MLPPTLDVAQERGADGRALIAAFVAGNEVMIRIGRATMASTVTITLADGRRLQGHAENGILKPGELEDKFLRLTRRTLGEPGAAALFERLQRLENEADLSWLGVQQ